MASTNALPRNSEQINGREGETATLFWRCLFTLNLRVGGFAPRHLNRWVASCEIKRNNNETMKILFSILFLTLFSTLAFAQEAKSQSDTLIVAGKGWGKVQVDANRTDVEAILGKGEGSEGSEYLDGVYFREYPEMGIQVSYTHKQNKVVAIFFYNKQHRYENMATSPVKIDKGIDWNATYKQVKKIYGKPRENYSGDGWRRVVYEGIDFRFENDVMVRIGIPGR